MKHIEMMQLAERVALQSPCADRRVGATILRAGEAQPESACNTIAMDNSNNHHAEARLISWALALFSTVKDATLYTTCRPCARCTEMLLPLGLRAIYYRDAQPEMGHLQALRDSGVLVDGCWIQGQVADMWAERNGVAG